MREKDRKTLRFTELHDHVLGILKTDTKILTENIQNETCMRLYARNRVSLFVP